MTKFKSGDIFQIPLPNELGFCYAMGIILIEINPNARYPVLIRVYNYRSLNPENSIERFTDMELILSPLLIAGIIPMLTKKKWKILGNLPLRENDKIIPHYKRPEPDEVRAKDWFYLIDADISKKIKSTYENVKHLETIGAIGGELVNTKIAMALLIDENKKIENYFKLEEYYEKDFLMEVNSIPAYYKLPDSMQGKALMS